jgi:hypothetical protein
MGRLFSWKKYCGGIEMKWVASIAEYGEGIFKLSDLKHIKCDKCGQGKVLEVPLDETEGCYGGINERMFNSKSTAIEYLNEHNLWQCNICKIWWYGHTAVTGGHYDAYGCKGGVRHCN